MALISCPECSTSVSDKAIACPKCGCPIAKPTASATSTERTTAPATTVVTVSKSRGVYIILGLLFGVLGIHDFYAGYNGRGAAKFCLLAFCFFMDATTPGGFVVTRLVAAIMALWTLFQLFMTTSDRAGNAMT